MVDKLPSAIRNDLPADGSIEWESDMSGRVVRHAFPRWHHSSLLIALAIASFTGNTTRAADEPGVKFLSAAVKPDGSITCSVRPGVDPLLPFMGTPATEKRPALEFLVTAFVGAQGDHLFVTPSLVELPDAKPEDQRLVFSFPSDRPVLTLKLKIPELPTASEYTGFLVVAQGGKVLRTHTIELARARYESIVTLLNAAPGPNGPVTCSVKPGVDPLLSFIKTPATEKWPALEFLVTAFVGERGDHLFVTPSIVELPDAKPEDQRLVFSFPSDKSLLTLKLKVPELPMPCNYKGNLLIAQEGHVVETHPIELARATAPRPVQLTTDLKSIVVRHTKLWMPWFGSPRWLEPPARFTMLVRNPNPEEQAQGVFLRLLEVTTPEGANFDPERNLTLAWNHQEANDLWHSPPPGDLGASPRAVAPNQQVEIGGEFRDLVPGEHIIKLGVAGANVVPEGEPQVTLRVQVRHSAFWAAVLLLVAIAVSFLATKGLEAQRRRVALLRRVSDLRPAWLRDEPATVPVVSVQAILKQAKDRNKNCWTALFGPDAVSSRVDKADRMLGILRQVHEIRGKISAWEQPTMIKYRAEKRLRDITAAVDPETVNEKTANQVKDELAALDSWITPGQLPVSYWSNLRPRIDNVLSQAKPDKFPDLQQRNIVTNLRQQIEQLRRQIEQGLPTLDPAKCAEIDAAYAELKILWECQQNKDDQALARLATLFGAGPLADIDDFFRQRDGIAWERLESACKGADGLTFERPPESTVYPLEAYELIPLKVAPADRQLGNNFLFRNGLEYRWSLDLETKTRSKGIRKETLAQPRTHEPRLVLYAPVEGTLRVSVTLCYRGTRATEVKMKEPLRIAGSGDFSWMGTFRFVEVAALVIATVFALVSGLATYYVGKPTFGSVGDYIALFIWGAGVDQTKNFIQHLAQSSPAKGPSS